MKKTDLKRLVSKAKSRKRYRLSFFNGPDGTALRLNVQRHDHVSTEIQKYCVLCGNNTNTKFRGHRTRIRCKQCDVHLCVKIRKPFKRSCWDVWHSVKRLQGRKPHNLNATEEEDRGIDEDANSSTDERPTATSRKRGTEVAVEVSDDRRTRRRTRLG